MTDLYTLPLWHWLPHCMFKKGDLGNSIFTDTSMWLFRLILNRKQMTLVTLLGKCWIDCPVAISCWIYQSIPDSYTVAPLRRRLPVTNNREARLPSYGALFSETEQCYCFPCSSIIYRHLMFSAFYFKGSLSTISIKSVNAMPLWNFLQDHFEVVLKIMTIAELFIVMTASKLNQQW